MQALGRGCQDDALAHAESRIGVDDRDDVMAVTYGMNEFVVAEKLDDVDPGLERQPGPGRCADGKMFWAHTDGYRIAARAAQRSHLCVVEADCGPVGDEVCPAAAIGRDMQVKEIHRRGSDE